MTRLVSFLLLLVLAFAPTRASADDAALAAKDTEIRLLLEQNKTLLRENSDLKERIAFLEAQAADLQTQLRSKGGAPSAPVPTSGGINQGQETSREQMKYLVSLFKSYKPQEGAPQWPALDGKNFVVWLVAVGQLEKGNEGPLKMLFSPADKNVKFPGAAAYAELTPEALTTQRFAKLTTYAGRRNSEKELAINAWSPPATTALLADLSFPDGALVAFLDGKVKYLNRKELGLAPTDPLVAGPASKSPLLQTLSTE
jgi:hypothetical protein